MPVFAFANLPGSTPAVHNDGIRFAAWREPRPLSVGTALIGIPRAGDEMHRIKWGRSWSSN